MNEYISSAVAKMRDALQREYPYSMLAGRLPPALSPRAELGGDVPADYVALLQVVDGADCGIIAFWSSADFVKEQRSVETYCPVGSDFASIGMLLYDPIFLSRGDGTLHIIDRDNVLEIESFSSLDFFLQNIAFGEGYAKYAPDPARDEWYLLLTRTLGWRATKGEGN